MSHIHLGKMMQLFTAVDKASKTEFEPYLWGQFNRINSMGYNKSAFFL